MPGLQLKIFFGKSGKLKYKICHYLSIIFYTDIHTGADWQTELSAPEPVHPHWKIVLLRLHENIVYLLLVLEFHFNNLILRIFIYLNNLRYPRFRKKQIQFE